MNRTLQEPPSTAAEWYARLRNEPVSADTDAAFRAWLDQHPRNETDYEHCEIAVELARELKNDPDLQPYRNACASLAASYQWRINRWQYRWLRPMPIAASLAAVTALLLGLASLILPPSYSTAIGEQRTVVLPDQTLVRLNTHTKITVDYSATGRHIYLKWGEALFEVTADKERPFNVFAQHGAATALGTVFDVAMRDDEVTVSVMEGTVRVIPHVEHVMIRETGRAPPVLAVGESVTYRSNGDMDTVTEADTRRINAWRQGKLAFNGLSLTEAVNEHNRYTTRKIVIGDNALNHLSVSGVFRIGDTDSLVFLLEESLGVVAVQEDSVIRLLPREKTAPAKQ